MNVQKIASIAVILLITGIVLIYGKHFFIPFVLAVFIWFIIREIKVFLRRSKYFRKFLPNWAENLTASILFLFVLGIFVKVISDNINYLSQNINQYQSNISKVANDLEQIFRIDLINQISEWSGGFKFSDLLSTTINTISGFMSSVLLIFIYIVFIFLEEFGFKDKIQKMFPEKGNRENVLNIIEKVNYSIGRYIGLKTVISFVAAILSYIALKIIGVDAAAFWAFIIFIMHFIPTVGAFIAILFPSFFALLQFGELHLALIVLGVLGTVQFIVGNILEPKIMGDSLNLSALVVLLALSLWGALWGIPGMVLSVPITVIILIVCSEFPSTRAIAILLSEKGKI